jgi:hypothetical protein
MAWFRPETLEKKSGFLISEKHKLVLILIGLMLLEKEEADKLYQSQNKMLQS